MSRAQTLKRTTETVVVRYDRSSFFIIPAARASFPRRITGMIKSNCMRTRLGCRSGSVVAMNSVSFSKLWTFLYGQRAMPSLRPCRHRVKHGAPLACTPCKHQIHDGWAGHA